MSNSTKTKNPKGDGDDQKVKTTKTSSMEWPSFLSESILDVIHNDFKFKTTTPVQVIKISILSI
jgi:hypothetical protein